MARPESYIEYTDAGAISRIIRAVYRLFRPETFGRVIRSLFWLGVDYSCS